MGSSANVENHRISQLGAFQGMTITRLELPNTLSPFDMDAWEESSNKVLVKVLLQSDSRVKVTKNEF